MQYIEALNSYLPDKSIFLAGGITNCPDWQQEIAQLLSKTDYTLLNPRRKNLAVNDPISALDQIAWEYHALRAAEMILFWFPCETLCPITLYELGAWSMTDKPLYIGIHPKYERHKDIEIQIELVRPDVKIMYSLKSLAEAIASDRSGNER